VPERVTITPDQMDRLARGLHKRQILGALGRSGLSVEPHDSPNAYLARDAEGRQVRIAFAQDGAVAVQSAEGRTITRWFDNDGKLTKLVDPGGLAVTWIRDKPGKCRINREGHGAFGVQHDSQGILSQVDYPDGTNVRFDLDEQGKQTVTDQAGHTTVCEWGPDGQVSAVTDRNGRRTEIVTHGGRRGFSVHTADGTVHDYELGFREDLTAWRVNSALVGTYRGEAGKLPKRADYADGYFVEFEEQNSRIVAGTNPNGTVRLTYDQAGYLVEEDQNGIVVRYERDQTGLATAIVLPDGERLSFAYDQEGRISELRDWSGAVTKVAWSASGQVAGIRHPNGVTTAIESSPIGLPTSIRTTSSGEPPEIAALGFEYDQADRIVAMTEGGVARRFQYDPVGRLTTVVASDPVLNERWQLDPMGNRVSDGAGSWSIDPVNRVSGAGAQAISYDVLGRTTSVQTPRGRATLRYNGQGRLVQAAIAGGITADYGYDAFGRRVWKSVSGTVTRYLWAGQTLLCEWVDLGGGRGSRRDHLFMPGGFLPLAMRVNGNIYRHHTDHRGAPVAMTDGEGRAVWRARLKAFGEAEITAQSVGNPWRLANQYADQETGLYYNLGRYYHPGLGRYLTPDPRFDKAGGGNLYLYAAGDPINNCDPTGEIIPLLIAGFVIGAAIAGAVKAYQLRNEPGTWGDKAGDIAKAALVGGVVGVVGAAAGAAAVAGLAAVGVSAAAGIGAAMVVGGVEGAVGGVAQVCAEAALYDKMVTAHDLAQAALIGAAAGAVTAGIGGAIAARSARKAAQAAQEAEQAVKPPSEPYNRLKHYRKTPTAADRQALGAGKGEVVDHDPPLVQRYYEGDASIGEKPGYQMSDAERRASGADRSRMKLQPKDESNAQGGKMAKYSREQREKFGLK
jgi:RHS repeat-associated protein